MTDPDNNEANWCFARGSTTTTAQGDAYVEKPEVSDAVDDGRSAA